MALPAGFTLEEPEQPRAAPPAPAAPAAAPATMPALPEGFSLDEEEGLQGTVTATVPKARPIEGRTPATSAEDLRAGLQDMTRAGAPVADIEKYVADSGFSLDQDTIDWFRGGYQDKLDNPNLYPEGPGVEEWDIQGPPPEINPFAAITSGLTAAALRGYDDEAAAGLAATVGALNPFADDTWMERYTRQLEQERAAKDAAYEQHPMLYGLGFIPGMLTGPRYERLLGGPGASTRRQLAGLAGVGGIEGALQASGNAEGGLEDRLTSAAEGAAFGTAAGPLSKPVADTAGAIGSRLMEYVPGRNSLNTGLDVLVSRAPQNAEEMGRRALQMREAGVDPRLLDVVDESGRGVVRSAGMQMTPAREEFARQADTVYTDMQSRVADQARRNITAEPRTARQISAQISQEQQAMGPTFDAVRNDVIPVTENMLNIFRTREGQAALRAAEGLMLPGERDTIRSLMKAVKDIERLGSVEDQAAKLVPNFRQMSPAAQQQILAQLDIRDPLQGLSISVDVADKFARAIGYSPTRAPGLARVAEDLANGVRNEARAQSPGYAKALEEFAGAARVGEAAAGTGRFEGSDFLTTPPDQYGAAVLRAATEPAAVNVKTPRDTTARLQRQPGIDDGNEYFIYTTRAGDEVPIMLTVDDVGTAEVDVSWSKLKNELGPAELRYVMADLQEMFPNIARFSGERISGARAQSLREKGFVEGDEVPTEAVLQTVPAMSPQQVARTEPTRPTMSERDALTLRARDDVVDRATSAGGQNAAAVARQFARGTAQQQRSEALLGPEQAGQLQRGMEAELRRVDNTRFVDPRIGSKTAPSAADAAAAAGLDAIANAGSGGKWSLVRETGKWLRGAGIRGVDAERIVRDAMNPDRTDAAIAYLIERGVAKERARGLIRAIGAGAAGRYVGGVIGTENKPRPPGSVRAITREGMR